MPLLQDVKSLCWLSLNSLLVLHPLFSCRETSDTGMLKNVILLLVWPMRSEVVSGRCPVTLPESAAGCGTWKPSGVRQGVSAWVLKDQGDPLAMGSSSTTTKPSCDSAWQPAQAASASTERPQALQWKLLSPIRHRYSGLWWPTCRVRYEQGFNLSPLRLNSWPWGGFSCLLNFCQSQPLCNMRLLWSCQRAADDILYEDCYPQR